MTDITINIVEASSNLAHNAAKDEMIANGLIDEEEEMWVLDDDDKMSLYTDAAQEVHTKWYDYFYDEISKCKSNGSD